MRAIDPYRVTDQFGSTNLQAIVTRIEVRGEHPYFAKMLDNYLDAKHVDTPNSALDLGCGTGVAAHLVHETAGRSGGAALRRPHRLAATGGMPGVAGRTAR